MIPIAKPLIDEEERQAVLEVLDSGQLVQGPRVEAFEKAFATWNGAKYAVATSSGTSALHIAMLTHGLKPGDEVVTPSFSFIASANAILYVGAKPVFADIELDYYTIDLEQIVEKITPRTKAILPVHLYGQMCDMTAVLELASEYNLSVIQDACQAHGAALHGTRVGAFGTACYSFYPTKNMTTIEGGMLTTNDPAIAERARMLRNHGGKMKYEHEILGYNFRMTEMQAAIGLIQLSKVDVWNQKRIENAASLNEGLQHIPGIITPKVRPGSTHVFHQYTIRTEHRDLLVNNLESNGIGYGIHYPQPIYTQPLYKTLGYSDHLEATEQACKEVLSLPVHNSLAREDLDQIINLIQSLELLAA